MRGEYSNTRPKKTVGTELPPRARRIREVTAEASVYLGTTSACAENTHRRLAPAPPHRNYLRVRGEYLFRPSDTAVFIGTTSACAENTSDRRVSRSDSRNYLRVRGEYLARPFVAVEYEELPPRARRIPVTVDFGRHVIRTTSACAENTFDGEFKGGFDRNYLRVRGEYLVTETFWPPYQELPPRARRILFSHPGPHQRIGTTSACAENTR